MRTNNVYPLHLACRAKPRVAVRAEDTTGLRFSLLGPVAVSRGGVPLELGPPQRRVPLTRLISAQGRPVGMDRLCDDLWSGNPPRGAVSAVRAHISRLRRLLEPQESTGASPGPLTSGPNGYSLLIADGARDTVQFERGTHRARELLGGGRIAEAHEAIAAALGHWRGPALADAVDHPFAAHEIARLEELRLTARELHIAVLLQAGTHAAAVVAVQDLTADQPLRETAWNLLMRALYLVGRPTEAIQAYERGCRILMTELGLQPGPALQELCLGIRRGDWPAVTRRVRALG